MQLSETVGHVDSKANVLVFFGSSGCEQAAAVIGTQISDSSRLFKASELWEGEHYLHVCASLGFSYDFNNIRRTVYMSRRSFICKPELCWSKASLTSIYRRL